jgi:hypothetical protein
MSNYQNIYPCELLIQSTNLVRPMAADLLTNAAATHIYDIRDRRVFRFRMFADTKTIWDAMS